MTPLLLQPARNLIAPWDAIPRSIREQRWLIPLLLLIAGTVFAATAVGVRMNSAAAVVSELAQSGKLATTSERDLGEAIDTAHRLQIVSGIAFGLFGLPILILVGSGFGKLLSWLLGRKARFIEIFTAAAVGLLPIALAQWIRGIVALWQFELDAPRAAKLVPSNLAAIVHAASPNVAKLLGAVDFFGLWSAGLLGLGFAVATKLAPARGLILGFILYAAYVGVFLLGLPGMGGGHA